MRVSMNGDLYGICAAASNLMCVAKNLIFRLCRLVQLHQIDGFVIAVDDLRPDLRRSLAFFRLLLSEQCLLHASGAICAVLRLEARVQALVAVVAIAIAVAGKLVQYRRNLRRSYV